jgi:hypothetical protein
MHCFAWLTTYYSILQHLTTSYNILQPLQITMVWTQGHGNVQAIEEAQRDVIAMVHDFTSQSRPAPNLSYISHTCHPHARVEARLLQFMALILGNPKHFFDQSPGILDLGNI